MQIIEGINYVDRSDWILVKKELHQMGRTTAGWLPGVKCITLWHPVKRKES